MMNYFPEEIHGIILSYVDGVTLSRCEAVCKTWHQYSHSHDLWKRLHTSDWGPLFRSDLYGPHYKSSWRDRYVLQHRAPSECLAIVQPDNNVILYQPDGTFSQPITQDAEPKGIQYAQPTFSPDGSLVALSRHKQSDITGDKTAIIIKYFIGMESFELLVLKTNLPTFYMNWSHDGTYLAFLANGPTDDGGFTIGLHIIDLRKILRDHFASKMKDEEEPQQHKGYSIMNDINFILSQSEPAYAEETETILKGAPLYFSWSPYSYNLVANLKNQEIHIVDAASKKTNRLRDSGLGNFCAPIWFNEEKGLIGLTRAAVEPYSQNNTGEHVAAFINLDSGEIERKLFYFKHSAVFTLSPCHRYIAFSGKASQSCPLSVLDLQSDIQYQVTQDATFAFFWTSHTHLVYITINRQSPGMLNVRLFNPKYPSHDPVELGKFRPSSTLLRDYYRFHDQFAQSMQFISRRTNQFVFSHGMMNQNPKIFIQSINQDEDNLIREICPGSFAIWSPF
eukprot:gb/GECH01002473.1/.p1 GENE.gb/GECH01002473.1/~~gb/GECH01002473.1/.p1  ORF type:complete len:506 (+),score=89.05 gb/GECH01002473.1/:1-1518(+)